MDEPADPPVPATPASPSRRALMLGSVAADGTLVAPGTQGAFPPAPVPFKGEDVKRALQGGTLPGVSSEQSNAYLQYIRRLQSGTSGFTCFASLQMPRP